MRDVVLHFELKNYIKLKVSVYSFSLLKYDFENIFRLPFCVAIGIQKHSSGLLRRKMAKFSKAVSLSIVWDFYTSQIFQRSKEWKNLKGVWCTRRNGNMTTTMPIRKLRSLVRDAAPYRLVLVPRHNFCVIFFKIKKRAMFFVNRNYN